MKTLIASFVLTLCVAIAFNSAAAESDAILLDKIIAIVNDDVVLLSELDEEVDFIIKQIKLRNIELPPKEIIRKQVLEKLIIDRLQLQEAEFRGIQVDDVMLNETIRRFASDERLSMEEYRRKVIADGNDYVEFREKIRKDIILSQIQQAAIRSRVLISDQEIDDFLSNEDVEGRNEIQYLVSHIMVSIPEAAKPSAIQNSKSTIDGIYEKLKKGADFAQLAISDSEGQNALEGGLLGWRQLNQLPSLFAKNIIKLKKGQYSEPIRSPSGFHILKLDDRKGDQRHVIAQINARHILIQTNAITTDKEANKKLSDLRKRITQGEDFEKLAKVHSEDPASAVNGGDLGWESPDIFAPQFTKVVERLPINKISEPFKTQFGWHIVEVIGRRDHDDTDEYRRNMAWRNIFQRKAAEEEQLWIRGLKDDAYIEYKLDDES